jgi:hypothetical protein
MRTSTLPALRGTALLALLVLAGPARAAGFSWGADLGFTYNQLGNWGADGKYSASSAYSLMGGLALNYSPFAPGLLDLGASAAYLGTRTDYGSASDGFIYNLRLSALRNTPVSVGASAFRSNTDFTAGRDYNQVGNVRVDGLTANALVNFADYPILQANWLNTVTRTTPIGAAPISSDTTSVGASASQSVDSLNYTLTYQTGWGSGDYAETNYRNHNAQLYAFSQLATNVSFQASANYSLRLPTVESAINPRIDNQNFSSIFQWLTPEGASTSIAYSYADGLFEAPGSPIRQATSHAAAVSTARPWTKELFYDLGATATASLNRAGAADEQATGELLNGGLHFSRIKPDSSLVATLTGTLGGYQQTGGADATAWGLGASFNFSRPIDTWGLSAGLSAAHNQNAGAASGRQDFLSGLASASGSPFGWYFSSMLTAGYSYSTSPTFGTAHRTFTRLEAHADRGGYDFAFDAAINDDLSQILVPGTAPTAGLVPVDFNTKNQYATLVATVPAIGRLSMSFMGRTLRVSSPGRPTTWEAGLSVSANYSLGAFRLSLYDMLTTGGSVGYASSTQNAVFFAVSRHFGR